MATEVDSSITSASAGSPRLSAGSIPTQAGASSPEISSGSRRFRSSSFRHNRSPARDSQGTGTGSASSSPKVSRTGRQTSHSKDGPSPEEDPTETHDLDSEGDRFGSLKKKGRDKKGAGSFGQSSFRMNIMSIFSAPHRQKNTELHKTFTSLPETEKLIDDYSCALQRDILIHGRLYVTQSWLCFYANIFSWETLITIPFRSVRAITKEKTALVIPNAIQIAVSSEKYGFSSLVNRDVTFNIIFKCWQNSLLNQPMTPLELVKAARKAYGESVDVGSEADLWGNGDEEDMDGSSLSKGVSMPTHLEIGRIPPTSSPSAYTPEGELDPTKPVYMSLPADLHVASGASKEVEADKAESQDVPTSASNFESPSSSDGRTVVATDYVDKCSMGGEAESVGSAEYETVSLIEETGEIPCGCSEHIGRTMLNDIYSTDVETMFRFLFTDSDFMRSLHKAEKTINVQMGEWQAQPDSSRLRDMNYTMSLNYSFGPKFTHTTEHQVYSKTGQPGLKHIVDTEVVNQNIPYGDTFYTVCRYCITRVAHKKTRLRVTANIKFKKSCWGLVKNLIERNAGDGLRTHYTHMDTVLKEHVAALQDKQSKAHRKSSRQPQRQRHKRLPNRATPSYSSAHEVEMNGGSREMSPVGHKVAERSLSTVTLASERLGDLQSPEKSSNRIPRVNLALTLLLGVLIVSNMMLYHHLMSYSPAPIVTTPTPPADINIPPRDKILDDKDWSGPSAKWQELLVQQLASSSKQTSQLKEALFSFVQTLENIEYSIATAKKELLRTLNSSLDVGPDTPKYQTPESQHRTHESKLTTTKPDPNITIESRTPESENQIPISESKTPRPPERELPTPKSELKAFKTPESELETPEPKLETPKSELVTPESELEELETPESELETPESELETPESTFETFKPEPETPGADSRTPGLNSEQKSDEKDQILRTDQPESTGPFKSDEL